MKTKKVNKKHIVVIGGGFAGYNFAKKLFNNRFYDVTLVDKNNYNHFTPLIYQVATSFLEPSAISAPFRKLFEKKGIAFRMTTLLKVDIYENRLYFNDGSELEYDILVFAAGSKTNFFGNKSLRKNSFSIKSIEDALYLRNRFIKTLEQASREKNQLEKQKLLTVVIAGGGATGVELAGMMAELKNRILGLEYPELKNSSITIQLIESGPHVLPAMSQKTQEAAYKRLKNLGINVKLNTRVNCYGSDYLLLSDGEIIETKTLIWTAGVIANTFEGISANSIGVGNRMITDHFNRILGHFNIFAIGDISIQYTDFKYPYGHPQLAQPAIQQGKRLAKNLLLFAKGKEMVPFRYFDKGNMAIIGRKWAVADLFKNRYHIGGIIGLIGWLFIHLISLNTFNNKVKTFYTWLLGYFTADSLLGLIIQPSWNYQEAKVITLKQRKPKIKRTLKKIPASMLEDELVN